MEAALSFGNSTIWPKLGASTAPQSTKGFSGNIWASSSKEASVLVAHAPVGSSAPAVPEPPMPSGSNSQSVAGAVLAEDPQSPQPMRSQPLPPQLAPPQPMPPQPQPPQLAPQQSLLPLPPLAPPQPLPPQPAPQQPAPPQPLPRQLQQPVGLQAPLDLASNALLLGAALEQAQLQLSQRDDALLGARRRIAELEAANANLFQGLQQGSARAQALAQEREAQLKRAASLQAEALQANINKVVAETKCAQLLSAARSGEVQGQENAGLRSRLLASEAAVRRLQQELAGACGIIQRLQQERAELAQHLVACMPSGGGPPPAARPPPASQAPAASQAFPPEPAAAPAGAQEQAAAPPRLLTMRDVLPQPDALVVAGGEAAGDPRQAAAQQLLAALGLAGEAPATQAWAEPQHRRPPHTNKGDLPGRADAPGRWRPEAPQ